MESADHFTFGLLLELLCRDDLDEMAAFWFANDVAQQRRFPPVVGFGTCLFVGNEGFEQPDKVWRRGRMDRLDQVH